LCRRRVVKTAEPRELLALGRGLYLILTSPAVPHVELAHAACERGVPVLQLREKDLPDEDLTRLARAIADVTSGTDTLFIVNDRPDIAAAAGADGVHVGQSDASVSRARDLLGPDALIGLSTRTPREAEAARPAGADYIGVGPVFPTGTKLDALAPIGLGGLEAVAARAPELPKVAIGGISLAAAQDVLRAGAQYVAVISAVCHASDPIAALDAFLAEMARYRLATDTTGDK
jgi:thiamine-phosphate pyrophosphorylase